MDITSLGYFGVGARDLEGWRNFGTHLVGLQPIDKSRSLLAFRMDDRKQRIVIDRSLPEGARFFGWEVENAKALEALAARLDRADVKVTREPALAADARHVAGLISFADQAGNRLEVFHGPQLHDAPFKPGRSISGFRTGALGLGHAVLTVERIDTAMPFYTELLGFRLSDYILAPFKAYFFHVNPRHHSLALIETGRNGMHHLMLEFFSLDDVGQAYDIAFGEENRVGVTFGRHTNDYMTSFYANTPSAFMLECGWGGREIDPAHWQPHEYPAGPSMWGHERSWLPPEKRDEARRMRMEAAANGLRQPVQVIAGNYRQMAGSCPWWDDLKSGDEPSRKATHV
ncbi:MAG: VOC family protein [Xanthobacteraceae bacterium]|nr:VOC family protein [Xanthobacteraceae bacterium]